MRHILILLFGASLGLFVVEGCSHQKLKSQTPAGMPPSSSATSDGKTKTLEVVPDPKIAPIESSVATKVSGLFQALAQNDDKKAKQSYGRASRLLPDLVQFAVDLKFHNYEHAKMALPKSTLSDDQKVFWQSILEKKPRNLATALCDGLKDSSGKAEAANPQDLAWALFFQSTVNDLIVKSNDPGKDIVSPLDEKLNLIHCSSVGTANQSTGQSPGQTGTQTSPKDAAQGSSQSSAWAAGSNVENCDPLTTDLATDLLTESFFDKLHNAKRKDTRSVKQNYKNAVKTALLQKTAVVKDIHNLVRFYKAVLASKDIPQQNHFLKRFKGIGRDMRIEDLQNRTIGDSFIEDDKDPEFVKRLQRFENENQLISQINRLDYDLAECALPPPAPVR